MSDPITLNAQVREITGKAVSRLRRAGLTPIVVYGPKAAPISLQANTKELHKVLQQAGTTGLIQIQVDGEPKARPALTRQRQLHPTGLNALHVDFLQVDDTHEVRTKVPVRVIGEPPRAVRMNEAMLRILIEGIEVRAKPADLPTTIEIDCSAIDTIGQVKRVRDLVMPKGVTVLTPGDRPVARLTLLRTATAEELEEEEGIVAPVEGEETEASDEGTTDDAEG